MKIDKIVYADTEKSAFIIFYEDGSAGVISNPIELESDKKIIDNHGGLEQVEKDWVDYTRDMEAQAARHEQFMKHEAVYAESMTIDAILKDELNPSDVMKIKMSMFKKPEVSKCKDKDLLTNLRKAEDIVDIIMYYGMIRNGTKT